MYAAPDVFVYKERKIKYEPRNFCIVRVLATILVFFCCFFCLNFRCPKDSAPDVQAFVKMRRLFGNVVLIYCTLAVSFVYGLYVLSKFI